MLKNTSDSRKQQLKELKSFTDEINQEITDIVGSLGWTMESVSNVDKEYFTCPYDPSHRLTMESFNDHLTSCQWKAEGYEKSDIPFSEPTLPANSPFSIKFDEQLQNEVLRKAKEQNLSMQIGMGERLVPRTSDRLLTDFTSDERRALYDYVIANTTKLDIGQDIEDINNLQPQETEEKQLSFLELLIYERNLKRRRAKHKGVHTNKKSQVEVLREVINQQMEIYTDYISGQTISESATSSEPMDVQSTKVDDLNYETSRERTEHLYKVFHSSSQSYNDFNSEDYERNDHRHRGSHQEWSPRRRDDRKEEYLEEKNYHRSRDQDRRERHSDEYRKHKHEKHSKSSHSRDKKSHKKDKHRSKDKHKDKYRERSHTSRHHDKSLEKRHSSKHSDYKRKERSKER
ncbi:U11/U12 small nuclear ribonucleoprotein 48 kDa protein [Linepithema humile]|uniref:U11/U12 small nuclear ribonucleoprotein 48 kDa protein n=1 Tax=Linepithema humile TaxID=83485 RepID=UPI0006232973|nr:PREDICTED: U11/U12 small nuclear ribonucleoprotein 48 kDa protein [Linepithema humile]